jgi:hypothetical protein
VPFNKKFLLKGVYTMKTISEISHQANLQTNSLQPLVNVKHGVGYQRHACLEFQTQEQSFERNTYNKLTKQVQSLIPFKLLTKKESFFITRACFWLLNKKKDMESNEGVWGFRISLHNLCKEFKWSLSTIRKVTSSLEEKRILVSKRESPNGTKWYSISFIILDSLLNQKNAKISEIEKDRFITKLEMDNTVNICQKEQEKRHLKRHLKEHPPRQFRVRGNPHNDKPYSSREFNASPPYNNISNINMYVYNKVVKNKGNIQTDIIKISDSKKEICNRMIAIRNEIFFKEQKIGLTNNRAIKLLSLLENVLKGDMEKWRELCINVNSSKFLMGEKNTHKPFKAWFDWMIMPDNASVILAKEAYDIGDRTPDIQVEEAKQQQLLKQGKFEGQGTAKDNLLWRQAMQKLRIVYGEPIFRSWFMHLILEGIEAGTVKLLVPNAFLQEWIMNNYLGTIKKIFTAINPSIQRVEIRVMPKAIV